MHDPMTVAFEIKWPWFWMKYRPSIATIWHVDPERDGSDDSCGRFIRSRHLDAAVLDRIKKRFAHDWDRVFVSDSKRTYLCGLFAPNGDPHFSVPGIVLNLFFMAACEVFNSNGHTSWRKARRWMQRNLFDILLFAENPTDSLYDGLTRKFETGCGEAYTAQERERMIFSTASCIYAWIARSQRRWWQHPRWHIHHWKIQLHGLQKLKRWLFSRCSKCGRRFRYGEWPVTSNWNSVGPRWFRSEPGVEHMKCSGHAVSPDEPLRTPGVK